MIIHDFFDILAKHGLHLKLSKLVFMQPQMDFLGVRISKDGVTIDPAKIAGLRDYPRTLTNLRQARGFLGVAGYHRIFVPNFSTIAAPITRLTSKGVPFKWGSEQQEAQEKLITLITSAPILVKPDPSLSRASPAPPHLKRGSYEKPPSPPSPALKPSYSQIVKTKKPPHDPEKQACDPKRTSCDPSRDISRDLPVPPRSHDQTRDQTQSRVHTRSHDRPHFGCATHPLIGTWQTVGTNQRSTRSQGIPHSLSMDTGTGNTLIGLRA